jgi:tetratricopeptide (TPR) repeat protein
MRLGLLLTWFVLATSQFAYGQAGPKKDMDPVARRHLERGLRLYDVQQYAEAIEEFRAGYTRDPRREFLYALGQAERQRGNCKGAIAAYESFLRTDPDRKRGGLARRNIARCQAALQPAPLPASLPTPAPAGPAGPASQPTEPAHVSPPTSPRVDAGSRRPPWYRDWVGHSLCAVGIAALVSGGLVFRSGRHAVDAAWSTHDYSDFDARVGAMDVAYTKQQAGLATMIAGGALVAAGVVRFLLRGSAERRRPTLSAAISPRGSVSVAGAFQW